MNCDDASRTTFAPMQSSDPSRDACSLSGATPPDLSERVINRNGAPWASQWIKDEIAKAALYFRK